jgi:hypothetical protein
MFIGNIVTKSIIKPHDKFNVVDSLDKIIESLPTLIIGWELVKQINPDADFCDRRLSDTIKWTFTLTEKRNLYEEDLYYFIEECHNNLISKVTYKYIDFILMNDDDLADTFKNIKNSEKNIAFKNDNMIYIYSSNYLFGIDLNIISFVGRNSDKLINYLKTFINVFLVDSNILIEYKGYMDMLNNQVKYIPYLYSIENE